MYIRATGNISAQHSFRNNHFLDEVVAYTGSRMNCIEPDYKDIIDPKMIRRMSRIIRMGVAAAKVCLEQGGVEIPDAIITGTAYGCLQDTDMFLTKMVEQKEELLTPTAFIQSTHNTIGAQIGLMIKSNNYNNAFVHGALSFESALLDGMMYLMENAKSNVLVGAVDEITDSSHVILSRFGLYKREPVSNLDLYKTATKGTMAGEGASFFLLSNEPTEKDYAKLDGLYTFYKPKDSESIENHIHEFLKQQSVDINDIDIVITGKNGDAKNDSVYEQLGRSVFNNSVLVNYKNLCGEYPTAIGFGLWVAANMLKMKTIPAALGVNNRNIKRILIYNHYLDTHHSLLLLSAC
jgi:3-oxoacyl-[acyl-carrier-protein] synthase II